jgi:superfamily I DNA/RNA helicase
MDTVELARRRAARIHQSAVDSGATPENPYALVEWIAAQRDLTIEKCEPGSAFLDGGRACYVPSVALIVHEKCSSEFEEAFLVAHELGHVELGDAKTGNVTIQADLTRGAEESPVGENRVAGYGIRQRRERQMDLFARELLLPRKALRNLYLQDGMSAAEISRRLNAPFATVAQQLLDALLLPEPAETSPAAPQPRTPNDEQRNAAKHRGAAYLLEAGPGTGKTECLILRVEHLVAEGTDPRRILLLTFSNKAAMEMGDRIASRLPGAAAAMWIGTFHAFGLDILRRFHREMGFEPEPKLIDRAEAAGLLEAEFPRLALTHYRDIRDPTDKILELLQAISRAKDEVTDPADYGRLVAAMAANVRSEDDRLRAAKADEVARVYAEYEQLKQARSLVDFGDLVMLPVKLCDRNGQVRQLLSAEYDHVLVDEYQDVNRSSVRLLSALRSEGRNLWVVGDSRQSIYRFRGASSVNLRQFGKEDFDGGVRAALVRNYRSTSEVLDSFVSFGQTMEGHSDLNLLSNRGGSGLRPQLIVTRRHAQKIGALAEQIRAMRSAGYMFRDQAVLCSGNETVARTARELERLGLPVLFLGNLFDRDEVKELLAFLSLLVDKRAAGLIRVGCMPQFAMELGDVASVLSEMRARPAESPSWLDDPSFATVAKSASNALERIKEALAGFSAHSTPWAVLVNLLLERTRLALP